MVRPANSRSFWLLADGIHLLRLTRPLGKGISSARRRVLVPSKFESQSGPFVGRGLSGSTWLWSTAPSRTILGQVLREKRGRRVILPSTGLEP